MPVILTTDEERDVHTRKGVTAVYARWDKSDLRREMATAVERSLRQMLNDEPSEAVKAAASTDTWKKHGERAAVAPPFSLAARWRLFDV